MESEMVSHINIAVEDELKERAKQIKNDQNMTWEQFMENAVEHFEEQQ